MKIALVYGALTPAGRLAKALDATRRGVETHGAEAVVVDLSTMPAGRPGEASPEEAAGIAALDAAAGVLLFSPVYRAASPGALKNFLDLTPLSALEAKPVGIVAMGATLHHFLGVDQSLHTALSWFGSILVPPGVYLTSESFENGAPVAATAAELDQFAGTMVDMAKRLAGLTLKPRPIAAKAKG